MRDGEPDDQHYGEAEVTDALLALSRVMVGLSARTVGALGADVTLPQFRTLILLVGRGPLRAVDLAEELDVTPSTATRMCDRLVRKGLVARHERPADRRSTWVALTASGRDLVGEAMRRRRSMIADLVADLSLTRPVAFAAVVNALVEAAGDVPDAQWWRRWERAVPEAGDV
ncbi:MarR family transcriptional regulator [Actinoplanes sp. NPDC023714]|uniref:MarR family winged helix-turn-helix transcriptional regulator n=1 Tax=Actinoplanes sp. NPDC023714 TaxID=3154322 RepID=UPI0033E7943E